MSRIIYVNGYYRRYHDSLVHVEDRGYQFADGVYESYGVQDGQIIDEMAHIDRLGRSLEALKINWPVSSSALRKILRETMRQNRVRDGMVYCQITRGVARRDHVFPSPSVTPSLVVIARTIPRTRFETMEKTGIRAISVPDIRWKRCDIKSLSLLPNVLARQEAQGEGAHEALFVDSEGYITEGAATNVWIVDKAGQLVTRPADHGILNGITRQILLKTARQAGIPIKERAFTIEEALNAREIFVSASSSVLLPVVRLNDHIIGNGGPGFMAANLKQAYGALSERT
ncbi:MAG: D-amino-acid transaminase [Parvularculales bacterium]